MDTISIIIIAAPIAFTLTLGLIYASRLRRIGPNQALVISGRGSSELKPGDPAFRLLIGPGRSFIWPVVERVDALSLEVTSVDFQIATVMAQGREAVTLSGTMQFKIEISEEAILRAATLLLSKSEIEIGQVVVELLEKYTRTAAESKSKVEIHTSPVQFASQVEELAQDELGTLGLSLVSLVIKKIK